MAQRAGAKRKSSEAPGAGNSGNGRVVAPDDNRRAILEAESAQLLSFMSRLMAQNRKVDAKRAELDVEVAGQTEIFRLAKAAGFQRQELSGYMKDMKGGRAKDLVEAEIRRRRHREALGLPTGAEQMRVFDSDETPVEIKDAAYWRAEGFLAYHRGAARDAADCPERFIQAQLQGWDDAQTATAFAMQTVRDDPEMARAQGIGAEDDEDGDDGDDFEAGPEELSGQTDRQAVVGAREGEPETEAL